MSLINLTDVYVAEGTYGIGDQAVYRNGSELGAMVTMNLKPERNELKKGGSGRTYDLSSTVGVTVGKIMLSIWGTKVDKHRIVKTIMLMVMALQGLM